MQWHYLLQFPRAICQYISNTECVFYITVLKFLLPPTETLTDAIVIHSKTDFQI